MTASAGHEAGKRAAMQAAIPATVASLLASVVLADEAIIERCRATSSDADRIACLEAAILAGAGHDGVTAIQPEPVPTVAADPAPPTEPAPAPAPEPEPELEPAAAPLSAATDDIGAEQVAARNRTAEQAAMALESAGDLAVERYETVGYQKLQVRLVNGQVWRQIPGDAQQIRVSVGRSPTVSISESALGGYRLRLDGIGRTIRVRRVQ